MDRGYLDFGRLYHWTERGAFFVTRARKNFRFDGITSHPVDKHTGVQCDQTVWLVWFCFVRGYPGPPPAHPVSRRRARPAVCLPEERLRDARGT